MFVDDKHFYQHLKQDRTLVDVVGGWSLEIFPKDIVVHRKYEIRHCKICEETGGRHTGRGRVPSLCSATGTKTKIGKSRKKGLMGTSQGEKFNCRVWNIGG